MTTNSPSGGPTPVQAQKSGPAGGWHYCVFLLLEIPGHGLKPMNVGLQLPYPLRSMDHVRAIEQNIAGQFHVEAVDEKGVRVLGAPTEVKATVMGWKVLRVEGDLKPGKKAKGGE